MSGGSVALFLRSVVSPRRLVYCAVGNGRVYLPRFHSAKPGKLEPTDEESVGVRRGGVGVGVWRGGKEFDLWKAKQKRFTRHITNLVRKGKVEEAEQVFEDMLSAKVRPTTSIFNNLIAGLSRSGHAHQAFKYFNDLKKRSLSPSNHTYTSLFRAFAEMGPNSRPLLEKVVAEIDRRDFLLNTIATNSLMVAMTTCGMGAEEVFGVYGDLAKRRVSPDVSTFTTLLAACSLDEERGMEKVPHVWQEMKALSVSPDLVCYHTLLRCLRQAGVPDDMKEGGDREIVLPALNSENLLSLVPPSSPHRQPVDDSSRESDFSLSTPASDPLGSGRRNRGESHSFAVVSSSRVNLRVFDGGLTLHFTSSGWRLLDPENVARFISAVREGGVAPDGKTLDHLSKMAADWPGAVREVVGGASGGVGGAKSERGVAPKGVIPDKKCLQSAILVQVKLDNKKAADVLRMFGEEVGILRGTLSYSSLALGCSSRREGLSLLGQMKEDGVTPDSGTVGILLRDAAARLDYEYLTALMKEMRHSKVEPDWNIWRILEKVANSRVPGSSRTKLRFNGFKGYYTLWKKHYPQLESREPHVSH